MISVLFMAIFIKIIASDIQFKDLTNDNDGEEINDNANANGNAKLCMCIVPNPLAFFVRKLPRYRQQTLRQLSVYLLTSTSIS